MKQNEDEQFLRDEAQVRAYTRALIDHVTANTRGPGVALAALISVAMGVANSIIAQGFATREEMLAHLHDGIDFALARVGAPSAEQEAKGEHPPK